MNPTGLQTSELVCTRRGDHQQTRITVSDNKEHEIKTGLSIALIIKYLLILLAALLLPALFFKLFILPFKILLGLKAISLLNSLLLGALLLRGNNKNSSSPQSSPGDYSGSDYPIPDTIPGSSATAPAGANSVYIYLQ